MEKEKTTPVTPVSGGRSAPPPPRSGERTSPRVSGLAALKAARRKEMAAKQEMRDCSVDERVGSVRGGTGLLYSDDMLLHCCPWDPHHIESLERLARVMARCREMGLVQRCRLLEAREAREDELLLFHGQEMVDTFGKSRKLATSEAEDLCRGLDSVYLGPHTDRAARLAAGGSVDLVKQVLGGHIHNGIGLVRPPGHHAMADTPCGFCGFNNAVLAAKAALSGSGGGGGVERVLIVDFDLHHGQGTQQAFYEDKRVVYMSVHRYEHGAFWPHLRESNFDYVGSGAGEGYNVNVALNTVGCVPQDYLAIFHSVFLPIATSFQPQLVIVSAGFDAAIGCPEGEMMVTPATYPHLLHQLSALAGGRLVVLLEGGYCLDSLAEAAALSLRQLLGDPCPPIKGGAASASVVASIRGAVTTLRPYWACLSHWQTALSSPLSYSSLTSSLPPEKEKNIFRPDLSFTPPPDWPPQQFPTRDYYPRHDSASEQEWSLKIAALVMTTVLREGEERLAVMYDPDMEKHCDDEHHPECPERTARIFQALTDAGVMARKEVRRLATGRVLTQEESLLVHDSSHWRTLHDQQLLDQTQRDELAEKLNSIYLNQHSLACGLLAAGGVLATVDRVLTEGGQGSLAGLAVVRPPGHHAEPDTPHGFCLFNNVAIAAEYSVKRHGLRRVLVLDWDVHHGNGIQHMFYHSNSVLYMSLHRYDHATFFPQSEDADYDKVGEGPGKGFNVNIPFNGRKMGDSEYLLAFQSLVLPIAYEFQPELVLVSAGFDAALGDPLGGYCVSPAMYGFMTQALLGLACGRVVVCLEGGYCLPAISEAVLNCARAMLGDPLPSLSLTSEIKPSAVETVRNVLREQLTDDTQVEDLTECVRLLKVDGSKNEMRI